MAGNELPDSGALFFSSNLVQCLVFCKHILGKYMELKRPPGNLSWLI